MSNASKKIKGVQKPFDEHENESEVNYCKDYEVKKMKTDIEKKDTSC